MLPDIRPGNTKILYFFNCLLDGMHTIQHAATEVTNIASSTSWWRLFKQINEIRKYMLNF